MISKMRASLLESSPDPDVTTLEEVGIRAMVREITYLEAVREAMTQEMERDTDAFF